MLTYMLVTKTVDEVLVAKTGPKEGPFAPAFVATDDLDELRDRRTTSVYYPCEPGVVPLNSQLRYAITLLPCQVEYARRLQQRGFWKQVTYVFELLCNYMPSPAWTDEVFRRLGVSCGKSVAYRGDGWPGSITVDGRSVPYLQIWSNDVKKWGSPHCKRCRRTCGESDWVVADPWDIVGDMGAGKTLARVQTDEGRRLVAEAVEAGFLVIEHINDAVFDQRIERHSGRRA